MLLAADTHYWESKDGGEPGDERQGYARARVAGILFEGWLDSKVADKRVLEIPSAAPYRPGSFYLRELPGLMRLLEGLDVLPQIIIIDGYVWLSGNAPGLGAHLWDSLDREAAVIGVAKSGYRGAPAVPVLRRGTNRPLFVSSAGVAAGDAARAIIFMYGNHRLPELLRQADRLARRGTAKPKAETEGENDRER